jgi:sulfur carrier protein
MMDIRLNGQPMQVADDVTVQTLLQQLGAAGKRVAVERNGEIVPRSAHAATPLAAGDSLEVVVAVGGG